MIVAVNADTRAQFLQAAGESPATYAQMAMRLAVFGDLPGSGWQFYTSVADHAEDVLLTAALAQNTSVPRMADVVAPVPSMADDNTFTPAPLAIALRGGSATVAGEYDPEELGSFCGFLGVDKITTPNAQPPEGYALAQSLTVYTLGRGQALPVPSFTGAFAGQEDAFALDKAPSVMKVIPLLFGADAADDIAMQEQYYSDNSTARNFGMAEFWLLYHCETPIFTLAASAVVEQTAYLSAGETIEAYRGQGIGGHYIATMANEYAAKGYDVCFVCEAQRCRFYERLGFQKSGVLYQYAPR